MIHQLLRRPVPVELGNDDRMRRRVRRLAAVSAVALGLVWGLAATTTSAPVAVLTALLAGWLSMPTVLVASLHAPVWRYGLIVPSALVTTGLLAIIVGWLPPGAPGAGWLLLLAGVLFGGLLGIWFWFRLLPVPVGLDAPDSPARWVLIAVHVALVLAGLALATSALLTG